MHLDVYFRDSLTIWPWRQQQQAQQQNVDANDAAAKTSAAAAAFFSEPDASTVNEMAKANVEEAMKRLPIIAPIPTTKTLVTQTQGGGNDAQQLQSVQKGVIHLVESALNPKNLARMEVSWQSWL